MPGFILAIVNLFINVGMHTEYVYGLTGLTPDGRTMEMPNEALCCLHTEEWQGAKPRIEALFD